MSMKKSNFFLGVILSSLVLTAGCTSSSETEEVVPSPSEPSMMDGDSASVEVVAPSLVSVTFKCDANPYQLGEDITCDIVDDSLVIGRIPNVVDNKLLIPDITFIGDQILIDGVQYHQGEEYDFRKPVKITLKTATCSKDYMVYVHSFTGLPVVWIETEGRKDITSKDEYLTASFRLEEGVVTRGAGDVVSESVMIKGRGNSSWDFAKKPYRLKFNRKVSLLGEPEDKSWVLIANYNDKTMLRNQICFYMGKMSKLDWTPRAHFVELMLNGKYNGTYLLCEKVKVSKHRVNIGDDGLLLEMDAYAPYENDTRFFVTSHLPRVVSIKEPECEFGDDTFNFAIDLMQEAENALFSDNFTDEEEGWRKYLDEESFIEWYLINEISKNADAVSWSSIFFNYKRGGKIKMGPIWDLDQTFGNCEEGEIVQTPDGFHITHMAWYARLFQDPLFVSRVKERYDYFYRQKEDIFREINENAQYLRYAVVENESKWHTLYTYSWKNPYIWGSYDNEVQFMKQWTNARMEWLKNAY